MYRLIYPTDEVSLADIAKAALAQCGSEGVTVVSGAGSQAIRVPESCADRVEAYAGVAPPVPQADPDDGSSGDGQGPADDGETADPEAASAPDETKSLSPDPDASTKAAGGAGGRPAG